MTLTVASLLKRYTEAFVQRYHDHLSCHVESTLLRIGFCRTAAMHGRVHHCPRCDATVPLYNSCTDRHCPQCGGARRADWLDKTAGLLRPETPYFHVVFTLPDRLSSLVLGNRTLLYRLLFRCAARALEQSLQDECGRQAAATMVLHTWNQRLEHHPHVHALVPGCGPSLDGTQWVPCRRTRGTRSKGAKLFLVDNKRLSRRFRDGYIRGVRRLWQAGLLHVTDPAQVEAMLGEIAACEWVVYIQPPPRQTSDPADVLKYLARYMTGGPISDQRLLNEQPGRVSFLARAKDKSGRQVPVSLSAVEFVRRWALHILPKGFTKARSYGGWSNSRREDYQQLCQRLQPVAQSAETQPAEPRPSERDPPWESQLKCPRCGEAMELLSDTRRPPWRELFYGPDHPRWIEWRGTG